MSSAGSHSFLRGINWFRKKPKEPEELIKWEQPNCRCVVFPIFEPHQIVKPKIGDVYEHVADGTRFVVTASGGNYFHIINSNGETDISTFERWSKEAGDYKPISRNQRVIVKVEND